MKVLQETCPSTPCMLQDLFTARKQVEARIQPVKPKPLEGARGQKLSNTASFSRLLSPELGVNVCWHPGSPSIHGRSGSVYQKNRIGPELPMTHFTSCTPPGHQSIHLHQAEGRPSFSSPAPVVWALVIGSETGPDTSIDPLRKTPRKQVDRGMT